MKFLSSLILILTAAVVIPDLAYAVPDIYAPWNCGEIHPVSYMHADRKTWDFNMPVGTPIAAPDDGEILFIKQDSNEKCSSCASNYLVMKLSDGNAIQFQHLMYHGVPVKIGQKVSRGSIIAYSGETGPVARPLLHVQMQSCSDNWACSADKLLVFSFKNSGSFFTGQQIKSNNCCQGMICDNSKPDKIVQIGDPIDSVDVPPANSPDDTPSDIPPQNIPNAANPWDNADCSSLTLSGQQTSMTSVLILMLFFASVLFRRKLYRTS